MTGRPMKTRSTRIWIRVETVAMIALAIGFLAFKATAVRAQSGADLLDRIQRLEAQTRSLNGQVEQLNFRNRQLEEQVRRLQGDLEFRLNELEGQRGGARPAPQQPRPQGQPSGQPQRQGRGDAFDPTAQQGGGTRPLGGAPGAATGGPAPLDLGQLSGQAAADPSLDPARPRPNLDMNSPMPPMGAGPSGVGPGGGGAAGGQPQIVARTPRDDYDAALGALNRREYERAETAFREFLRQHPRDRLVGDATHGLGETLYQRRQYRDAAEQFLKVSTDFPPAGRAPSSLLRLGQSLNAIGERDAACAAFAEFGRKFPNAQGQTRTAVTNEQRRLNC